MSSSSSSSSRKTLSSSSSSEKRKSLFRLRLPKFISTAFDRNSLDGTHHNNGVNEDINDPNDEIDGVSRSGRGGRVGGKGGGERRRRNLNLRSKRRNNHKNKRFKNQNENYQHHHHHQQQHHRRRSLRLLNASNKRRQLNDLISEDEEEHVPVHKNTTMNDVIHDPSVVVSSLHSSNEVPEFVTTKAQHTHYISPTNCDNKNNNEEGTMMYFTAIGTTEESQISPSELVNRANASTSTTSSSNAFDFTIQKKQKLSIKQEKCFKSTFDHDDDKNSENVTNVQEQSRGSELVHTTGDDGTDEAKTFASIQQDILSNVEDQFQECHDNVNSIENESNNENTFIEESISSRDNDDDDDDDDDDDACTEFKTIVGEEVNISSINDSNDVNVITEEENGSSYANETSSETVTSIVSFVSAHELDANDEIVKDENKARDVKVDSQFSDLSQLENDTVKVGVEVIITKGKHKGKRGKVTKLTEFRVKIETDEGTETGYIPRSSIRVEPTYNELNGNADTNPNSNLDLRAPDNLALIHTNKNASEGHNSISSKPKSTACKFLEKGMCVLVEKGKYKGEQGLISRLTDKKVVVELNMSGCKMLMQTSVKILDKETSSMAQMLEKRNSDNKKCTDILSATKTDIIADEEYKKDEEIGVNDIDDKVLSDGSRVFIVGGKHEGKTGIVTKNCPKMIKVEVMPGDTVTVSKRYVSLTRNCTKNRQTDEWRVPDYQMGEIKFGNFYVASFRIRSKIDEGKKIENSFLEHFFGCRIKPVDVPLKKSGLIQSLSRRCEFNGFSYDLVSSKIVDDTAVGGLYYKPKMLRLMYVLVAGPDMKTLCIREELESIADFSALSPRKVVSRLELLQSPACTTFMLASKDFCKIHENGHTGCGFIDSNYLTNLMGNNKEAKNTICIQIRAFIPSMGIFKGMLMRKRIEDGFPPIQLPDSMKKVGPGKSDNDDRAMLIICQAGKDPSQYNRYVGRLPSIDPSEKPPPKKSFKPKSLGKMIRHLLQGLKVPNEAVQTYENKVKKNKLLLSHAYVRGVSDPTSKLPPGQVFLTGVKNHKTLGEKIFVTRSPCIKCTDGKMITLITHKPENMSEEEFNFLQSLPFGAIIFAFPREGCKPLPELIASGDLDGDRYFVCWEEEIISKIQAEPIEDVLIDSIQDQVGNTDSIKIPEESKEISQGDENLEEESAKDWFRLAQDHMITSSVHDVGELISKLYKLSQDFAEKDKERFIRNPDAEACADAYYEALEHGKHGTKIVLPVHIHEKIPKRLRPLLSEP